MESLARLCWRCCRIDWRSLRKCSAIKRTAISSIKCAGNKSNVYTRYTALKLFSCNKKKHKSTDDNTTTWRLRVCWDDDEDESDEWCSVQWGEAVTWREETESTFCVPCEIWLFWALFSFVCWCCSDDYTPIWSFVWRMKYSSQRSRCCSEKREKSKGKIRKCTNQWEIRHIEEWHHQCCRVVYSDHKELARVLRAVRGEFHTNNSEHISNEEMRTEEKENKREYQWVSVSVSVSVSVMIWTCFQAREICLAVRTAVLWLDS